MINQLILVLAIVALTIGKTYGQCCSAGNPSSFALSDKVSLQAKSLQIWTTYKYGYSDKYFAGNKKEDVPFNSPASFSYMDIKAGYGINKFITIQAETGYFFSKKQINHAPIPDDRGYGLGDLSMSIRYRFYKNTWRRIEANMVTGIRLPVGVFDQEIEGVKLPITLQPSSGSVVYTGLVSISKSLKEQDISFFASVGVELPQQIESKNFYYKYGNLYNFSVAAAYRLNKHFIPAVQLQGEFRGHATREDNQVVDASGYKIIYLSPQVESEIYSNWSIRLQTDVPIYRYFNGLQLANAFKFGITLSKKINLNS